MKRASKTLLLLVAASALAAVHLPGPALADSGERKRSAAKQAPTSAAQASARPAKGEKPRRVRNFDFLGDKVTGEGILPSGESVHVPGPAEHGNLIRLRAHFVREIAASANHL